MAEQMVDVRGLPRDEAWAQITDTAFAILDGVTDDITAMATMSCLLREGFGFLWAGFYRVVAPGLLRVGPYQGSLGCLEIAFERGVCGAAATQRRSIVVADVHSFPGHIACDGRSASELVVPVLDARAELIAVLDIDADTPGAFDEVDARGAERLVTWFARRASTS